MRTTTVVTLAGTALALLSVAAVAADSALPGDHGRPREGIPGPANVPGSAAAAAAAYVAPNPPPVVARAPAFEVALKAAQAIVQGCKQFRLGVAVVNAEGIPILIDIPDGSQASHGYMAVRKAYSAVTLKASTSQYVTKAQQDPELAARIKADPNLMAFSGGILLKVGDDIVGAIGVSGAEPGSHDEECGLIGLQSIKNELK